jgi:hypothetical protein
MRQREEWHLDIFQAKAVKVYDVPQEKVLNKLNSKERHLVSSVLRKLIQAVRQLSYPLSAMAEAINAASSPIPYKSADFIL